MRIKDIKIGTRLGVCFAAVLLMVTCNASSAGSVVFSNDALASSRLPSASSVLTLENACT